MNAKLTFQKALMLLDRGADEKGVQTLRDAVRLAKHEADRYTLVPALCCLSELAFDDSRLEDASALCQEALSNIRPDDDDLFDQECQTIKDILLAIADQKNGTEQ